MGSTHPDTREKRTWYELCSDYYDITVMIVEAPLTFGHSQLILKSNKNLFEEDMFINASNSIKKCINIMRNKLPTAVKNNTWKELCAYTKTTGGYKKTILLKVSADEKKEEYKVHLVPYFESHLESTTQLFHLDHHVDKNRTGGLLGWLGKQERRVDSEIELLRNTCRFPKDIVKSFELEKLADYLRKE